MRRPSARPVLALALTGLLAGCQERTYTASLQVDDGTVVAGEASGYTLVVTDDRGEVRTGDARVDRIEVSPSEGVTQGGGTLTFTVATAYNAAAVVSIDGQEIRAETTVEVKPAAPERVEFAVSDAAPIAGEPLTWQARLTDRFGNAAQPPGSFKIEVSPRDGVTLNPSSGSATFTKAVRHTLTATELGTGIDAEVQIDVLPASAQSVRLGLSDARITPGLTIEATLLGLDGFGNEFPLEADFDVAPTTGVQVKSDGIRFSQEGTFTIEGRSGELFARGTVVVDGTPPALAIASPARAAFVSDSPLTVAGTIEDPIAGLAFLRVNGQDTQVRGNGFSFPLTPQPGTNVLTFEAEDLNGNPTSWVQSFLYAPAWTPLGTPTPGGLYGRLNQETIDLVTTLLLEELDPDELEAELEAENPIYSYKSTSLTTTVNVTSFGFDLPVVGRLKPHADSAGGYLEIQADFENLTAELEAYGKFTFDDYHMEGRVSAEVATARAFAYASIKDGKATVNFKNVDVTLNGLDLWFSGNVLDAIGDIAEEDIREELEAAIEELIIEELPPLLADTLNYLNYSTEFEVPIGENSATFGLVTQLESLTFDDYGLTLGETTTVNAVPDPRMPPSPGAPKVGAGDLRYPSTPGYLISASSDALNTALHALWATGLLTYSYSVSTDTGQSLTAKVDLPLPPVIQPSQFEEYVIDASAGDILLDLYTDANSSEPTYTLSVSLIVPATVVPGESGVTISVLFGEPVVAYQVLKMPSRGLDEATLGNLVEELASELLALAEESTVDIALPEFEGYQLTISEVRMRGSSWGYLSVGGSLQ